MAKGEVKQRYQAVAVGKNINPGEGDKAPTIEVEMRVVAPEQFAGLTKYVFCSLHDNAQEYTVRTLRTLGWKCNDITALEGLGSTKVDLVETEEEWKGKPRRQCSVYPIRGPRPSLRDEDMKDFAARFKGLALSAPAVDVSDFNAAPATLPEKVQKAAAGSTITTADSPTALFE